MVTSFKMEGGKLAMKCLACMGKGCVVCVYTGRPVYHDFVEKNERYTPSDIIEAARHCMGCIDFDPASCKKANEIVKATRYYTYKEDGLKQQWYGNGWCNPPFGRVPGLNKGLQELFVEKAIDSYENGYVEQMILLLNGHSPYGYYFRKLWKYPICFHEGRVDYIDANDNIASRSFGTVLVYMGFNSRAFYREFLRFGAIVTSAITA